jgi:CHAT domain-containing protein/Tfp pilus assembly protein PilF
MVQEAKSHYLQAKSQYETILQRDITQCRLGAAGQTLNICNSWANVSDNIGELYNTTGDIQSALDVFRETLAIRKVLDQPQSVGSTLSRICYSHVVQGKVTEALDECNEALTYNRNAEDLRGSGSTLTFLGMIYTALNKPEDAMRSFEEALQLQRQASERRGEGIALNQYGLFYVSRNQPEQALAKYEQALKLWQETRDEDGETITLYNIARLERDRGNLSRALDLNKRALNIIESRRTTLSSEKLLASYFSNKQDHYELQTDLQMLLGQPNKSTTFISEALVTNEHARGRQLLDALSETHVLNIANQDGSNAALAAAIKRRIQLQVSLRERASSRTTLLSASARKEEELSSINQEINKLTDDYDEVESTIRSLSPPYASLTRPTPVTSTEIQLALDQDTLLLEYALGEKRSYVWAVTPDSITGFQLESRDKIEAVANRLVEALTARNRKEPSETFQQEKARVDKADRDYAEAAQQLSKMVVEPVASLLVNRNRLVIVADGALQYVPFAALPISVPTAQGTNTQKATSATNVATTLITNHELVSLPSASVLALQRRELANRKAAPLKLAILADPVFDLHDPRVATALARPSRKGSNTSASKAATPSQNPTPKTDNSTLVSALRDVGLNADGTLRRLLFSRTEAADISRLVPPKESLKALDFKASRATAMSGELSKYQYVHFATHGVLSLEHPELSGIALSMVNEKGQKQDGYLRLYEIYNLDLPAELVVLSACETGVGKQIRGEGLIALTRGFMYAGAKRVVASLWKVDDSATAALMAQFYKEMFVSGRTPAAALKEAQKTISQQPRWRSPYYWAGFVLQGEWR